MGGSVHSIPLFIVFARNEHGEMPHENTPTKREPVLSCRKKKKKKELWRRQTAQSVPAGYSSIHRDAEGPKTTTAGLLKQLDWISLSNVACTPLRIRGLR